MQAFRSVSLSPGADLGLRRGSPLICLRPVAVWPRCPDYLVDPRVKDRVI
jgi:hypothetical protein